MTDSIRGEPGGAEPVTGCRRKGRGMWMGCSLYGGAERGMRAPTVRGGRAGGVPAVAGWGGWMRMPAVRGGAGG